MRKLSSAVGVAAALTSFLGAPDMAAATPCGMTTLDNWLVSGFSCTVGDHLLARWPRRHAQPFERPRDLSGCRSDFPYRWIPSPSPPITEELQACWLSTASTRLVVTA